MKEQDKLLLSWKDSVGLTIDEQHTRYWVSLFCSNCQHKTDFTLPKGTRKAGVKATCEKCGCTESL